MIKMYITQYNPSRAGQLRHRRVEDEKQERTEFNTPSLEVCYEAYYESKLKKNVTEG